MIAVYEVTQGLKGGKFTQFVVGAPPSKKTFLGATFVGKGITEYHQAVT
jgi:hypothetical protein